MRINWKRILIAGIVAEALLVVLVNVFRPWAPVPFLRIVLFLGGFVFMFLAAGWAARKIESRFIAHGTLIGVIAVIFYSLIAIPSILTGQVQTDLLFFSAHIPKIIGGAAGGFIAGKRRKQPLSC